MKTYISKNLVMACLLIYAQFNCMAQSNHIAMNEKSMIHSELLVSYTNGIGPVKIIDYCFDDTNVFGSQIFDLGLDANKYVIGILNVEENSLNQKQENIIARTCKRNGKWHLEVEDLDSSSDLSINSHCIKLMVYNKQHN